MSKTVWGIHMADIPADLPLKDNFIGIGWVAMGNLSLLASNRDAFKNRLAETHLHEKAGAIPVKAGVNYRFVHEMKIGDVVIYPSKSDRMVNIGVIESDYRYEPDKKDAYPNRRQVKWVTSLPRATFSQSALHEIGSAITLFSVTTHAEEFLNAMEGHLSNVDDLDDESADVVSVQVEETTEDFIIKRLKSKLTPYEFEKFIAHLLTCMGYHARVTQQSADGGIDIIAHKDELGFEPPIIKVQCKQTLETTGRPKVQELHGAIENGEHGLFVTLGAYSSDARTFERSKPHMRLIDGNTLIDLIYSHYQKFEPRYQVLLPLKRTYIPGTVHTSND